MPRPLLTRRLALLVAALLLAAGGTALAQDYGTKSKVPAQRCFGAASRDPQVPCSNPKLRTTVFPKPADAVLEVNSPCRLSKQGRELYVCDFGAPAGEGAASIALIGDSHAADKRAALQRIVTAKGWSAVSMTQTGCPYTAAKTVLDGSLAKECSVWKPEVTRYLREHPDITTIVVAQHALARVAPGRGGTWATKVQGYLRQWKQVPASVQHIVVLRDTPRATPNTMSCVERARRGRRPAGTACAVPRRYALPADPAVAAARRADPARVQVLDLSDYLCSPRLCFPVIGGALVHKDTGHITQVFATTLGPIVQREIERLMRGWDTSAATQPPSGGPAGSGSGSGSGGPDSGGQSAPPG